MRKRDVIMQGYVQYIKDTLIQSAQAKNCLPDNQADIQHRH